MMKHTCRWGLVAAGILLCASQSGWLLAADKKGDLLEETKRRLELTAQKVESEVNDNLADAEKLSKTEPAKAAQLLRRTLFILNDDVSMTATKRDSLLKALRDKIQKYDSDADRKAFEKPVDPKPAPKDDERRRDEDRVKAELDAIRTIRDAGRSADADRRMDDLSRRYPDNPAVKAWRMTGRAKDTLAENDRIKREREEAFNSVGTQLEKTMTIPVRDVTFPSDWKSRVEKRTSQPQMTKKEKSIMDALQTQITVELEKTPLTEVLDYLSKKMDVPISVEKNMLEAVGAAGDQPVTVVGRDVTLRTVLRKVLGEVGLTYIVEDEMIKVVTPEVAKNKLVIRSYSVADLIWVPGTPQLGPASPFFQQAQLAANVQNLISMIVTTIEPESWEINGLGGKGTIAFYGPTMSLIIKQSAELHMVMGSGYKK
jgi:hypothetical protein